MRYLSIIIGFVMLCSMNVYAGNFQQKMRSSEEMQAVCQKHIQTLQEHLQRLESIPVNQRSESDNLKIQHFRKELRKWNRDCNN